MVRRGVSNGLSLVMVAGWTGLGLAAQPEQAAGVRNQPIVAILVDRCLGCHSGAEPSGSIDLTRPARVARGEALADDPRASRMWQVVAADEMPQDQPLTPAEKAIFRDWIASGAPADFEPIDPRASSSNTRAGYDWWAWQPLRTPPLPEVQASARVRTPLDRFVLAELEAHGLTLAPEASPRDQVRRLYFDLIGLPPPPEVVAEFARDPSDARYAALVDLLLASPEYGERWGRHWLDIVRYGESDGFERNAPRHNSWPYRDWVIEALNADLPFDEFTRRQIAGDQLCADPREGAAATGFLVAGVHNTVVGASRSMQLLARQDELEDLIGNIGQTFLGLTVNCARCHDHKFDPVSQREYYQLVAAISDVQPGTRQVRTAAQQQELADLAAQIAELEAAQAACVRVVRAELVAERRAELAAAATETPLAAAPEGLRAAWDLRAGLADQIQGWPLELEGDARQTPAGLVLDGSGDFARSPPVTSEVGEKTLVASLQLADLQQQGGAALSLETLDGEIFDAIVYGEQEAQRWMAGSNGFTRTQSWHGPPETATGELLHIAISYAADGTIRAYRNGDPFGQPYRSSGLQRFAAGASRLLVGLRHSPAGGNRFLHGTIAEVQLYDRVLSPAEVASLARTRALAISSAEVLQRLPAAERQRFAEREQRLAELRERQQRCQANDLATVYTAQSTAAEPTHLLPRGDVLQPGEQLAAALPAVLVRAGIAEQPEGVTARPLPAQAEPRVRLAAWLTAAENALFRRVIANRVWHYHFGRGLVATPSDLGFNGGQPSHPDLLDWLSGELQRQGMRLKPVHRTIVTSSAYRQGSVWSSAAHRQDADNRLLWRYPPRRLDAESARDAMLWVSGRLNPQRGGPGFADVEIVDHNNGTTYYEPLDREDPALNRRTIYRFTPRGGRSALLDSLDCPDPSTATPRRSVTTTPLQALSLQNNDLVWRLAAAFAAAAESAAPYDRTAQVAWMFRRAYGREASPTETAAAGELGQRHGLAAVARALFNSNEFMIVP